MENDPDYVNFLDNLPEPLRSAWRHGDWDIFAGQYFTEWNPKMHIIPETLANKFGYGQEYNKKYIGIDWGFAAPFACIWIEVTPDNRVFCYRELYGTEKHPTEWGQEIMNMTGDEEIFHESGRPFNVGKEPNELEMRHTHPCTQTSL